MRKAKKTPEKETLIITSVRVPKWLLAKAKANHLNISSITRDALKKAVA